MQFRLHRRQTLAILGAWALPLCAAEKGALPRPLRPAEDTALPRPRAGEIAVAPLPLQQRRLANGLQVIAIEDHASSTASVQVWVHVGGKDDPPGRSGFAHLFEHMMFKSTRHMPSEMFDRLTEDVGGANNAFTAEDVTAYQNVVPANHLERLLWAEAERMVNLSVDQANFDSERAVVVEEYRSRVLADPYGRLFHAIPQHAFEVHPYRRPVIGSLEDLNAATLEDVRAFHRTFYRPDNAVLIVAGDFDAAQLERWVDRYFGPLRRPEGAIPRVTVREPRRTKNRRASLTGPNVPVPAVALLWQGPPASHDDAAALHVASALLSAGESARLNESLVYRDRIAQGAAFAADLHADAGVLIAYAIAASGQPPRLLENALLRGIERLAEGPIPAGELDKVRAQLVTQELVQRQTPLGKAEAVGWGIVLHGDPRAADRELARLQAVRATDVQRVLRQHVRTTKRVSLDYTEATS
jgi:zinc protease